MALINMLTIRKVRVMTFILLVIYISCAPRNPDTSTGQSESIIETAISRQSSTPKQIDLSPTASVENFELGDIWNRPSDEMVMVSVPVGTFQMGSNMAQIDGAISDPVEEMRTKLV